MSESPPDTETRETLKRDYLELTKRQTSSTNWTKKDRERLQGIKAPLGIDQPKETPEQKRALHRQGFAGTNLKGKPQPPLTREESEQIMDANIRSKLSS